MKPPTDAEISAKWKEIIATEAKLFQLSKELLMMMKRREAEIEQKTSFLLREQMQQIPGGQG